jgi:hypothetical protein
MIEIITANGGYWVYKGQDSFGYFDQLVGSVLIPVNPSALSDVPHTGWYVRADSIVAVREDE